MDYKAILKSMWKRSKISYLILVYSATMVYLFSLLRLGNHILLPVRKWLEKSAREEYKPSKPEFDELEWFATYAIKIFQFHDKATLQAAYPTFEDHIVDEYREARYTIIRDGSKVYISIRGSENAQNFEDGMVSELKPEKTLGRKIHSGYNSVGKGIFEKIKPLIKHDDIIYLTGGSMGHAVSLVVGMYLHEDGYNIGRIWGFAGPRVTDYDYGYLPVTNVFILKDPVVYLPTFHPLTRWRHQGNHVVLVKGVWYLYQDSWKSDLLLSPLFMTEKVDVSSHTSYADELLKFKETLKF